MGSNWTSAAAEGHIAKFETLSAEELASVVAITDEDGRSLLHLAVAGGHLELLELLVATSAAPSVVASADEEVVYVDFILLSLDVQFNHVCACITVCTLFHWICIMQCPLSHNALVVFV